MAGRLARAWGFNGAGELGDGTTTEAAGPVQVTGLTNATQVAAGAWFSLAVRTMLGLLGQWAGSRWIASARARRPLTFLTSCSCRAARQTAWPALRVVVPSGVVSESSPSRT